MFKEIKVKLEEAILGIRIHIDEALAKGDSALVGKLQGIETGLTAHIATLEGEIKALEAILVASISVSPTGITFSMASPAPQSIATTIYPIDASNHGLSFSSQDTSVATVDEKGNVTSVGIGSTQIVVASADGNAKAFVSVSVAA